MWGDKPFASLKTMSPKIGALAISQDKIGWRNLMEGCISMMILPLFTVHTVSNLPYLRSVYRPG
jgi:hypothetical protein